jgi:hypothetical protein
MSYQGSSQVTDFASLASALARFGKVGRVATNQKVGSSSPPGRTTFLLDSLTLGPQLTLRFPLCNFVQLRIFQLDSLPDPSPAFTAHFLRNAKFVFSLE